MAEQIILQDVPIVITGAARGMGRAYARDAARKGARLVLNDVDGEALEAVADELRREGADVIPVQGSVSDTALLEHLLGICIKEFGSLRGLVNNAGVFHVTPVWEEDPEAIRRMVAVNYTGAMLLALGALSLMASGGGGSIVNVSSVVEMGMYGSSTYGATKGAMTSATRSMAAAGRRHRVRVNAISPRGSTRMIIANGREFDESNPAVPPELTGPVVSYLLSDLASDVTGQVIRLQVETLAVLGKPHPGASRHPVDFATSSLDEALGRFTAELQPYGWKDPVR